jgi:glycosyltransferase involved in cell wall biosynthesis
MNVAIVYDRVNKIGGAERVLCELHKLWPDAPLYTSVYNPKKAEWAHVFDVKTTFLQHIPFAKNHHEWFAWLTPFAFGSLSFDQYDVVISVTSAEAKGIITKPHTLHICYCLTPTRYLWSGVDIYKQQTGFGIFHTIAKIIFTALVPTLRTWDLIASQRPDIYVAISQRVKKRIQEYYKRSVAEVIYPPVDTDLFQPATKGDGANDYYLVVSRLVSYKRVDIVVGACTRLGKKLIVIGTGPETKRLQKIAGPTVTFIDHNLTDKALFRYYQNCRAFLYAGDEDFGIVAGEAQACGKPVIAYSKSGVSEIVRDGITGLTFQKQSVDSLKEAIRKFENMTFSGETCRKNAQRFNKKTFLEKMNTFVSQAYQRYPKTL